MKLRPRRHASAFFASWGRVALGLGFGLGLGGAGACAHDNATTDSLLGEGGSAKTSSTGSKSGSSGSESGSTSGGLAGSGGSGMGTGTATGAGGGTSCATDAACLASDPAKPVCDKSTGLCVGCLPASLSVKDACPNGQFCDASTNACAPGCKGSGIDVLDCGGNPATPICNPANHTCTACAQDADCPAGEICESALACVQGCDPQHACAAGDTCCGSSCYDLTSTFAHCGACGTACSKYANAVTACTMGVCAATCDAGWADCNANLSDGCEENVWQNGPCACTPGATQPCYDGSPGTEGVGPCRGGTQTCDPTGLVWGACVGEVLPVAEICNNGIDDDCDGVVDDVPDYDGDGWTRCNGDCCDVPSDGCAEPALVNPGAYDVPGNGVDDDCNGKIDDAVVSCDTGLASNATNAALYVSAIDICQTTQANAPLPTRTWGVISGSPAFTLVDGTSTPNMNSASIRTQYGSNVVPLKGAALAVLSSGFAAAEVAPANINPAYASFQTGQAMGTSSAFPADWLAAHGGKLPNAPGCPAPTKGSGANDPIMLTVQVRVPTNAQSFTMSTFFYSAEYPEWVCSPYNDFFLALLDSAFTPGAGQSANPTDKNLATYTTGGNVYPVGVNLAYGGTGLFSQCKTGPTGCEPGAVAGSNTCASTLLLAGTGFDLTTSGKYTCGSDNLVGGGTGWLTTGGNVKPGETMTLRLAIWDTSDEYWDSLVLLDNFAWSLTATTPGTHQ